MTLTEKIETQDDDVLTIIPTWYPSRNKRKYNYSDKNVISCIPCASRLWFENTSQTIPYLTAYHTLEIITLEKERCSQNFDTLLEGCPGTNLVKYQNMNLQIMQENYDHSFVQRLTTSWCYIL